VAASKSFSVDLKMRQADSQITAMQVPSTPTLVVAGKYRPSTTTTDHRQHDRAGEFPGREGEFGSEASGGGTRACACQETLTTQIPRVVRLLTSAEKRAFWFLMARKIFRNSAESVSSRNSDFAATRALRSSPRGGVRTPG
jgi:hypothetical protein